MLCASETPRQRSCVAGNREEGTSKMARPKGFEPQTSASGVWKNGVFIGSWCKKTLVLRCGALVWTGIVFHTPSILFHTRVLAKKNGEAKQHKNRRWARKIKAKA
jgi:hypothetical protein